MIEGMGERVNEATRPVPSFRTQKFVSLPCPLINSLIYQLITFSSSTSKMRVLWGGIMSPAPCAP